MLSVLLWQKCNVGWYWRPSRRNQVLALSNNLNKHTLKWYRSCPPLNFLSFGLNLHLAKMRLLAKNFHPLSRWWYEICQYQWETLFLKICSSISNVAKCWDMKGIKVQFLIYFYYANIFACSKTHMIVFEVLFDNIANNYIEMWFSPSISTLS